MGNCPPGWNPNSGLRSWETAAVATPPGLTAGSTVVYNRVVQIYRTVIQATQTPAIGDTGYSGETNVTGTIPGQQQLIYANVPAAISLKAAGRSKGPLPADVVYLTSWSIVIPVDAIPEFGIRDKDIAVDDDQYRYFIGGVGWTALQWNLECIRLEA